MTDLSDRYGTGGRPRWLWPVIAAVGVLIGIAWAAWVGFQPKPVSAQLYGYEVVDDHRVDVTLDVHRPDPLVVRCTVYAQAEDHSTSARRPSPCPPTTARTSASASRWRPSDGP